MGNDNYRTPDPVYNWISDEIKRRFNLTFDIDLAASEVDKKCPLYIGANSQFISWSMLSTCGFCNPPYSRPHLPQFTEHAYRESIINGYKSVLLVPFDVTNWFRDWVANKAEIWVPDERIAFINPDTGLPDPSPPKGSMILLYGPMATPGRWETVHIPQEKSVSQSVTAWKYSDETIPLFGG